MSAVAKLRAKLPGNPDINGLDAIAAELIATPEKVRCAFVWYDVYDVREIVATGDHVPTIEVRRFEPIGDAESVPTEIREAVAAMADKRLGKQALPFEQVSPRDDEDDD
ncbi:hypothetical protein ABZX12_18505 [Kribbella sp. NPDC003505]|uniref:hypothetical protein n=1 Tax=Kribbella sp. NPDC003505 TaxID=3154448 RepID=UPI0033AD91AD